jgi:RNA polymerase sigma factor (sigma-70 family)
MTPTSDPTRTSGASDEALLREFGQRRQEDAFAELVRRHGGIVLSVCRSVLGNTSDAEDAAQAVFLTLAQKASSRPVHRSLVAWLHRVAWYVATRAAQARAVRRRHEQEAARMQDQACPPDRQSPELLEALHAGLARLPEKYRTPLILHHFEGRTQEQTAALLGCSLSAAGMRLNRGRQMLRAKLRGRGAAISAPGLTAALTAHAAPGASPAFVAVVAQAAAAAAAGQLTSTALISAQTLTLWKGAIHMLFWTKMQAVAAVLVVALTLSGVGTFLVARAAAATAPAGLTGTITQASSTSVSIAPSGGSPCAVTMNAATVVKVNGKVATAGDLQVGMRAIALGDHLSLGQPATEIRAYTPPAGGPTTQPAQPPPAGFSGTITQVGETSVSIQPSGGDPVAVTINAATVVKVNGKVATAADLQVGMRAFAVGDHLSVGQPATEIRAYTPKPQGTGTTPPAAPQPGGLAGTITQIGDTSVSIQPNGNGNPIAITINAATVVKVNGKVATAVDLQVGMRAMVIGQHLSMGQPATEIRAYMPQPK